MDNVTITEALPKKVHPLFNDWQLKCEKKITSADLDVRIALHVFSTIEDYKWESLPSPPAGKFEDMDKNEQKSYICWVDENMRRWAKNKNNLRLLIESRRVLRDGGFGVEAEAFTRYIYDMREHGVRTFREHTCYVCKSDFQEEI